MLQKKLKVLMLLLRCHMPKAIQRVHLMRLTSCGKFKALHAALTCSLWTIDKGFSQIRTSTPPSHGLHVYFERFILPSGKILPSPSFKKCEICLQSWRFYINLFFNLYWRKSFFLLLLLRSANGSYLTLVHISLLLSTSQITWDFCSSW